MKKWTIAAIVMTAVYLVSYWSSLALPQAGKVAAYRGGGQLLDYVRLSETDCSAASMLPSANLAVENTLQSLDQAIRSGVEILHLNVRRSKDHHFVVFHDNALDCATNGSGLVREKTLAELIRLDVGYQFTSDQGASYPFRHQGYAMTRLEDVLNRYPQHTFWINLKDDDDETLASFTRWLESRESLPSSLLLMVSQKAKTYFDQQDSGVKSISVDSTKTCVKKYLALGWSGYFPHECAGIPIMIPPKYARYLWGFPSQFSAQAQKHGSSVFLWTKHTPVSDHRLYLSEGVGIVSGDLNGLAQLATCKNTE